MGDLQASHRRQSDRAIRPAKALDCVWMLRVGVDWIVKEFDTEHTVDIFMEESMVLIPDRCFLLNMVGCQGIDVENRACLPSVEYAHGRQGSWIAFPGILRRTPAVAWFGSPIVAVRM